MNSPIFTYKGENYLRYFSIICLVTIIGLSIYAIKSIGYVMIIVILFAVFGLFTIRFPFIKVYSDHFSVEKRSIFKKFTDFDNYRFEEIREIKYIQGYTNWAQMIFQSFLGKGAYGGFSKPDQIELTLEDNKIKIIYRFGSRKEFRNLYEKINE